MNPRIFESKNFSIGQFAELRDEVNSLVGQGTQPAWIKQHFARGRTLADLLGRLVGADLEVQEENPALGGAL
jgi:hypothetical protein